MNDGSIGAVKQNDSIHQYVKVGQEQIVRGNNQTITKPLERNVTISNSTS